VPASALELLVDVLELEDAVVVLDVDELPPVDVPELLVEVSRELLPPTPEVELDVASVVELARLLLLVTEPPYVCTELAVPPLTRLPLDEPPPESPPPHAQVRATRADRATKGRAEPRIRMMGRLAFVEARARPTGHALRRRTLPARFQLMADAKARLSWERAPASPASLELLLARQCRG
jgi:hypothetical protein